MEKEEILKRFDELLHSDIDFENKTYLLKLRKLFIRSFNIKNIEELENKLYKNMNYRQKFDFEVNRILDYMEKLGKEDDYDFLNNLKYIKTKENMLRVINNDDKVTYQELLLDLIELEIDLNMSVGLFLELREFVFNYLQKLPTKKHI